MILIIYKTFQKYSTLNFTHELNKNNKILFLNVFIDTTSNNNFTNSTYKKPNYNPVPSTLKENVTSNIYIYIYIDRKVGDCCQGWP